MSKRFNPDRDVAEWHGPAIRYDLLKEVTVGFAVVLVLALVFAVVFSSPDESAITLQSWSKAAPVDFVQTAITELDGTSASATYGAPYNHTPGTGQQLGPISIERAIGVHIPLDTSRAFVIDPLETLPRQPALTSAIRQYKSAPAKQQTAWTSAYEKVVGKATFNGALHVAPGSYGPVAPMMTALLGMARSGALDGALTKTPQLYGTDYTKPLLFIADGTYMGNVAQSRNLLGNQWGMMNETGQYPGQAWLWLYTLWYQVPPMNSSSNGDVEVWAIMMGLTVLLALVPFIPGLRSIPRWTRIYRLIWRRHYRSLPPVSS